MAESSSPELQPALAQTSNAESEPAVAARATTAADQALSSDWKAWSSAMMTWALSAARHRYAVWTLVFVSWSEAIILPVPPDAILAPMALAQPRRWWQLALLATLCSVLGGLCCYAIGSFFFEWLEPWLYRHPSYAAHFDTARSWFHRWGVWALLIVGFTPLPFKLFTFTAGVMAQPLLGFIIASGCGRGARFAIISGVASRLSEEQLRRLMGNWRALMALSTALILLALAAWWLLGSATVT